MSASQLFRRSTARRVEMAKSLEWPVLKRVLEQWAAWTSRRARCENEGVLEGINGERSPADPRDLSSRCAPVRAGARHLAGG